MILGVGKMSNIDAHLETLTLGGQVRSFDKLKKIVKRQSAAMARKVTRAADLGMKMVLSAEASQITIKTPRSGMNSSWRAVVLAASRGPDDPLAKAYGIENKCSLKVGGVPMLARVVSALEAARLGGKVAISIDDQDKAREALNGHASAVTFAGSGRSAPESALIAIRTEKSFPVLVTTCDHALLTPAMVQHVIAEAEASSADFLVSIATKETINADYPDTKRTYFNLAGTRVSGCNLFAITNERGLKLFEAWQQVERDRKKPWKIAKALGLMPLVLYLQGKLTPQLAFEIISEKVGCKVRPVFMPFSEAAIDVDKPADYELVQRILSSR
jgi:GTP:adenosylcobinamide-phosphate guanylyltransferase